MRTSSTDPTPSDEPTILVVDDNADLLAMFAAWLDSDYDVRTATDAPTARERLDEDVAAVLLDRRMPGTSGDELLDEIRDRDGEFAVAMLTAVDPDADLVDMPCDAYEVKPVDRDDLLSLAASLVRRSTYDEHVRRLYAVASKRAALLDAREPTELNASPEFAELTRQFRVIRERTDGALAEFDADEYDAAFGRLPDGRNQ